MNEMCLFISSLMDGWTPGVGDGQGGLECCGSWGRKESDTTEIELTEEREKQYCQQGKKLGGWETEVEE